MKSDLAQFQEVSLPRRAAGPVALPLPLDMALMGCGAGALGVLRTLVIAVIGCGSIGGRIGLLLARMGLGKLLFVDPKKYKPASLATHEIAPEDVGQPKALAVARRCKAISPATRALAFVGPVEALGLAGLADVDLVVMAPDLLAVEVELGQRCLWLGKPLVQASVHGPTLTVQIRFFQNAKGAGGCPACSYGRLEWDWMTSQVRFSCEGAKGGAAPSATDAPATNSLSALCSMASNLAVIQILRFLLKLGQPVGDTMLEYNGFTHRTVVSPIARNPNCKLEHSAYAQVFVDAPLGSLSLAQMTQHATNAAVAPDAQFEVAALDWVEFAACSCAPLAPVRRFLARGGMKASRCPKCAAPFLPLSFYTHRRVSATVLGSAVDEPLQKLGARRVDSVLVRTSDTGVLIRHKPSTPATT